MITNKEVLEIFKSGICEFVEIAVKQQHEKLLGRLPDITRSGFTKPESCSQCDRYNLKPRHSKDECPSLNNCFCKYRRREKRACPNLICDYICEGIIEDHVKYSPNFKTTDISQWTKEYWDIAKCYMEHSSQSAENTDILDLLHLIANNRFVFQKVLGVAKVVSEEQLKKELDKVIKICRRIKRLAGSSKSDLTDLCIFLSKIDDQSALKAKEKIEKIALKIDNHQNRSQSSDEYLSDMRNAVYEYYKSAESALTCKTEVHSDLTYLQLFAEQTLHVRDPMASFEEVVNHESNIVDLIFGSKRYNTIFVESLENEQQNLIQWSRMEWFIFNILNIYFNICTVGKDETVKHFPSVSNNDKYSGIILVSKSVLNTMKIPVKIFCDVILKDILKKTESFLVIMDVSDTGDLFNHGARHFKRHTVIRMFGSVNHRDQKSKKNVVININPVDKLTIRNVCEDKTLQKEAIGIIQQMIFKSMKKIGCKKVSLTFDKIIFEDVSTKIKLSRVSEIPCLQMIECAFTPTNIKFAKSIEIISAKTCIIHYLDQMKLILYQAIQNYQDLRCIKSSEIKTGNKSFCIKISLVTMNTVAQEFFKRPLKSCSRENIDELLDFELAKILMSSGCDIDDYIMLAEGKEKENERLLILSSIRYGLLKSNSNFVQVYPAECHLEGKKSQDIVFVCFMKENYDDDEECVFGTYRGFKTFQRSYNAVSTESLIAESTIDEYNFRSEEMRTCIEETVAFHSDELMEKHSNLELISVSMGKAKDNSIDTTDGPCIVLYVRLVSFIPKGENHFPDKLKHPTKLFEFPIDVREGYYISLLDRDCNFPCIKLQNLVMGCSFGMNGEKASGTVGPFVQIESGEGNPPLKDVGFLTACHNFCFPENAQAVLGTEIVQPSDGDFVFPSDINKVCGEVVACAYTEEVDAALVKITERHPQKGAFISCHHRDIEDAKLPSIIKYDDGSISEPKDAYGRKVVKFGQNTLLTMGECVTQGITVKIFPEDKLRIQDPLTRKVDILVMKNMFHFRNNSDRSICDKGDSGAGVFLVNENKELSCIGMAIGKTSDGSCVAVPIRRVLEKLSDTNNTTLTNLKITMKKFC